MNTKGIFSHVHDNWKTPDSVLKSLELEFGKFDLDPCPIGGKDGLSISWKGKIFVNPPYSDIYSWLEKGQDSVLRGDADLVVYLLPVRTDTKWFHEFCLSNKVKCAIRFFRGRLRFGGSKTNAPFPSMIVIFTK